MAKTLEQTGADCIMIGANAMHNIADMVKVAIHIPIIHIAEETAWVVQRKGINKAALLAPNTPCSSTFIKTNWREKILK